MNTTQTPGVAKLGALPIDRSLPRAHFPADQDAVYTQMPNVSRESISERTITGAIPNPATSARSIFPADHLRIVTQSRHVSGGAPQRPGVAKLGAITSRDALPRDLR